MPLHIKVEINCKEHFSILPLVKVPFKVENMWYKGEAELLTYQLDELIGTKLRALYQRRKGRDLFDLYQALTLADLNVENVLRAYNEYMDFVVESKPTYKQFMQNMTDKMQDPEFLGDTEGLLRYGQTFDPVRAFELVKTTFIDQLPGRRD